MAIGLFYFGANIVALTANLLTGAGLLISNPRSFNARVFAGVTVSLACYAVGRLSYAVPAGFWMILAYSLFQDQRRIPRWKIAAFAVQALLSTVNAFGYVGLRAVVGYDERHQIERGARQQSSDRRRSARVSAASSASVSSRTAWRSPSDLS